MSQRLVTIWRFNFAAEAHLWKAKLEAKGIPSVVIHEMDIYSTASKGVELQVKEKDVGKASKIIEPLRKKPPRKLLRSDKLSYLIIGCVFGITGILIIIFTLRLDVGLFFSIFGAIFIFLYIYLRLK